MAKGLFGGLFGGQGLQMVGKLTKQNMEKLQASKPHDEKNSNDKYRYRDKWKYLYTEFSLWTKVNKI